MWNIFEKNTYVFVILFVEQFELFIVDLVPFSILNWVCFIFKHS